jgi:hypothetical protein
MNSAPASVGNAAARPSLTFGGMFAQIHPSAKAAYLERQFFERFARARRHPSLMLPPLLFRIDSAPANVGNAAAKRPVTFQGMLAQ